MIVGEITQIGRYTVRCSLRFDNAHWPRYVIYVGARLIGAQFSMPCETDCQWLERRKGQYAKAEESQQDFRKYGYFVRPRGRPSRAELERRAVLAQFEVDAEVSA